MDDMKKCNRCNEIKPKDQFYKWRAKKDGLTPDCKECRNKLFYKFMKDNPELNRKVSNKWSDKNRSRKVMHQRKTILKKYGLTLEDYGRMVKEQDHKCKICNKPFQSTKDCCVDHDHSSGKVRGLLCPQCNFALGAFKDSISSLEKAICYLRPYNIIQYSGGDGI